VQLISDDPKLLGSCGQGSWGSTLRDGDIARIPEGTYLRWVWPLLMVLSALVVAVLAISAVI
jgi:hypothetical protein